MAIVTLVTDCFETFSALIHRRLFPSTVLDYYLYIAQVWSTVCTLCLVGIWVIQVSSNEKMHTTDDSVRGHKNIHSCFLPPVSISVMKCIFLCNYYWEAVSRTHCHLNQSIYKYPWLKSQSLLPFLPSLSLLNKHVLLEYSFPHVAPPALCHNSSVKPCLWVRKGTKG